MVCQAVLCIQKKVNQKWLEWTHCKLHTPKAQGNSLCHLLCYNLSKLGVDYISQNHSHHIWNAFTMFACIVDHLGEDSSPLASWSIYWTHKTELYWVRSLAYKGQICLLETVAFQGSEWQSFASPSTNRILSYGNARAWEPAWCSG